MDRGEALRRVRDEASTCTACDLYRNATQMVFGEGRGPSASSASLMLVGEQPGHREDVVGRPFVGPAGGVLDRALEAAGIDRSDVYLTNAVKHFRFEVVAKRRIHQKPTTTQIVACRQWLTAELDLVNPSTVVCLGVTAARAVFGKAVTIGRTRGREHVVDWAPGSGDRAPVVAASRQRRGRARSGHEGIRRRPAAGGAPPGRLTRLSRRRSNGRVR